MCVAIIVKCLLCADPYNWTPFGYCQHLTVCLILLKTALVCLVLTKLNQICFKNKFHQNKQGD